MLEVNVLGVYLCCRAVIPGMLERGSGRIVITASGAAYLPGSTQTAYSASKAAVARFGETLARQLERPDPGLPDQPGPRPHRDDATVPRGRALDAAGVRAALVRALASGASTAQRALPARRARPAGRARAAIEQILRDDLNAIRLRR